MATTYHINGYVKVSITHWFPKKVIKTKRNFHCRFEKIIIIKRDKFERPSHHLCLCLYIDAFRLVANGHHLFKEVKSARLNWLAIQDSIKFHINWNKLLIEIFWYLQLKCVQWCNECAINEGQMSTWLLIKFKYICHPICQCWYCRFCSSTNVDDPNV